MPENDLPTQLNEQIERLLADPGGSGGERNPLLEIAAELRDLPRPEFKARLRADLERSAQMSATSTNTPKIAPVPEGYRTVTPYMVVKDAAGLLDFMKQAFGAEEVYRASTPGGGMHAEARIGDSMVMMGGGPGNQPGNPAALHYFVEDPDAVYERALQFGARSLAGLEENYNERFAAIQDPFGNEWYIARSLGDRYVPEGLHNINVYLKPHGAQEQIEFLKRAFGAEEMARYETDGIVHHAKIRVGNSVVELGEAHGLWQPMATMVNLYVPSVDEVYRRALAAGAISIAEPADQPYGNRTAGVRDAFGHTWYIATRIKDINT